MPEASGWSLISSDTLSSSLCPCPTLMCSGVAYARAAVDWAGAPGPYPCPRLQGKRNTSSLSTRGSTKDWHSPAMAPQRVCPGQDAGGVGDTASGFQSPAPPEAGGPGLPGRGNLETNCSPRKLPAGTMETAMESGCEATQARFYPEPPAGTGVLAG